LQLLFIPPVVNPQVETLESYLTSGSNVALLAVVQRTGPMATVMYPIGLANEARGLEREYRLSAISTGLARCVGIAV